MLPDNGKSGRKEFTTPDKNGKILGIKRKRNKNKENNEDNEDDKNIPKNENKIVKIWSEALNILPKKENLISDKKPLCNKISIND